MGASVEDEPSGLPFPGSSDDSLPPQEQLLVASTVGMSGNGGISNGGGSTHWYVSQNSMSHVDRSGRSWTTA